MSTFKIRSVKFNLAMNIILRISGVIFPLITFPYVARTLLPEGNGKIAFATSVINYFSLFATLGIPTYGIRACAKNRNDKEKLSKTVFELLLINCVLVIVAYIILAITIGIIPEFKSNKKILLIQSSTIILNMLGVEWFYQAIEQYEYITIRNILFKIISLILMFVLVHSPKDILIYSGIYVVGTVGSNIVNIVRLPQLIFFDKVRLRFSDLQKHMKPILMLFLYNAATQIYTNLDTVMLGFMCGNVEVGIYNVAIKIKNVLCSLLTAVGAVTLPRISNYLKEGKEKAFNDIVKKSFQLVVFLAFPIATYFVVESKSTVLVLAGEEYIAACVPLIIIVTCVIFVGMSGITAWQMLIPMGRDSATVVAATAGGVIDFSINYVLIPKYGAVGAAIGTLIAEIIVLLIEGYFLKKYIKKAFPVNDFFKVLLGCIIAGACAVFINKMLKVSPLLELMESFVVLTIIFIIIEILLKNEFLYQQILPIIKQIKSKREGK